MLSTCHVQHHASDAAFQPLDPEAGWELRWFNDPPKDASLYMDRSSLISASKEHLTANEGINLDITNQILQSSQY